MPTKNLEAPTDFSPICNSSCVHKRQKITSTRVYPNTRKCTFHVQLLSHSLQVEQKGPNGAAAESTDGLGGRTVWINQAGFVRPAASLAALLVGGSERDRPDQGKWH